MSGTQRSAKYDARVAMNHDSPGQHAIDAWESEGGGSAAALGEVDAARTALADILRWRANSAGSPASKDADAQALTLAVDEDRILRCLGAAVIMRWNTIPTKLQRELFGNASSMGDLLEADALKGQVARFLHKHEDDTGQAAKPM